MVSHKVKNCKIFGKLFPGALKKIYCPIFIHSSMRKKTEWTADAIVWKIKYSLNYKRCNIEVYRTLESYQ